ncbi:MAG: hypothetical protein MI892_24210 [Desulfobacterales bacterium]|nr:hypothetical protein [Desulfobacterales bacterium]
MSAVCGIDINNSNSSVFVEKNARYIMADIRQVNPTPEYFRPFLWVPLHRPWPVASGKEHVS